MTQISFQDILTKIHAALMMGNYGKFATDRWLEVYQNGEFIDHWQGYVTTVHELASFLRSVIGIHNGTESLIILNAIQLAFND